MVYKRKNEKNHAEHCLLVSVIAINHLKQKFLKKLETYYC